MQVTENNILLNQDSNKNILNEDEIHLKQSGRIFIILMTALFVILWTHSDEDVLVFHKLMGTVLGILTLAPLYRWVTLKDKHIPFIELVSLHFFIIFCPQIFLGPVTFVGATQASVIRDDDLTRLLLIILTGIISLFIGYYLVRLPKVRAFKGFHLDWNRAVNFFLIYLGIAAVGPILVPRLPGFLFKVGHIIFNVNGCVATYALTLCMYSGKLSFQQHKIFLAELVSFLALCLASGWLGVFLFPIAAFFLGMIQARNRIPWLRVLSVCVIIIILQMSKGAFRDEYWGERMGGSAISSVGESFSRSKNWLEMAIKNIGDLGEGATDLAQERANHLSFFGHVTIATPKYIPYLDGYSYKCVPAMFVPRILWHDKPSTMDVTNELVIRYGWLSEQTVGTVAFSAGLMDEAYMNFGTAGVIIIMAIFGMFIRWMIDNLGNPENGFGWQLALLGFMIGNGLMVTWISPSYLGGFGRLFLPLLCCICLCV